MAEARVRAWWDPGWGWKVWVMAAAMVFPTLGFAVWVLIEAGGETSVDEAALALARANAGGQVIAIQGTEHTIYHALGPAFSLGAPGRWAADAGLVHGSGVRGMRRLAGHQHGDGGVPRPGGVHGEGGDRDTAAGRYAVGDNPAFLLVDASGAELGRFPLPEDEAAFRAELDALLARTGD